MNPDEWRKNKNRGNNPCDTVPSRLKRNIIILEKLCLLKQYCRVLLAFIYFFLSTLNWARITAKNKTNGFEQKMQTLESKMLGQWIFSAAKNPDSFN